MNNRKIFLIALLLFLVAFIPRFLDLGTAIVADEQLWIRRSINFMRALFNLDLSGTFQTPHPGVTTMWLGSIFIGIKYFVFGRTIGEPSSSDFLFAAQLPIAIVTSLTIVVAYFMIRKIFNEKIAIISGLLLALSPFYLAYSRIIHLDALLASFMTLSLLSFLIYMDRSENSKFLVMSGIFAGLAVLTKVPAFFLFPFIALLVFSCFVHAMITSSFPVAKLLKKFMKIYSIWILTTFGVIFIIWPAMWLNPFIFTRLLTSGGGVGTHAHEHGQFFMGTPVADPGFLFYPVVILFRTTPITLIFLVICIGFLLFKFIVYSNSLGKLERNTLILILYVLLFIIFMSLGAKKLERYILPVFPILDIIAAVGLFVIFEALTSKFYKKLSNKNAFAVLIILVFVVQSFSIIAIHPYPLSYYNPVVGGSAKAQEIISIGRGEGLDLAAKYLNQKEDPQNITVASNFGYLLATHFNGEVKSLSVRHYEPNTLDEFDYLVMCVTHVQRQNFMLSDEILEYHYTHEPEYTVIINGIEYVWIYKTEQ